MKIILLQGGSSSEREISLKSSKAIAEAIKSLNHELIIIDPADYHMIEDFIKKIKNEAPDLIFLGLHGGDGEDGTLQAVLKTAGLIFTGSDHTSSAIAMNKYLSTMIAQAFDIPIPMTKLLTRPDSDIHELSTAVVIKPNSAGSSVGTHIVKHKQDYIKAVTDAFKYDSLVLEQEFIKGKELTVSILGDTALPVVEIKPIDGFYDYDNKYIKGKTEYICPAHINEAETTLVQGFAKSIFQAIGCKVYGRVDFIYDGDKFYFLEVNTLPGMTELSLVPMAAKEKGIDFNGLIEQIIAFSIGR